MDNHNDTLGELNKQISLKEKIVATHSSLSEIFPFIVRIAVAIYDSETSVLKTFLHSSGDENPLGHYQTLLDDVPSLKGILASGLPRVVNNLVTFDDGKHEHEHTKRIGRQGYAASYTLPIFDNDVFIGFVFFNSNQKDVFCEKVLRQIDIFAHLISLLVVNELTSVLTLTAAIKTAGEFSHVRDPETGSHLDRMSRYSRLIASSLSSKYHLDDSYIEHIFMFSPLHDIGKIGIPDDILLKTGKLDNKELAIMQTHAHKGRKMIDDILENFGLENIENTGMLQNIAEYHHENIDGGGYPSGKKGTDIPLEARIVAVADVFDALTSARSYKEAWDNERAIDMIKKLAGKKLDIDCVYALIDNIEQVEQIQKQFKENPFG